MKKIVIILIIALCLLFLVLPAIAAADGKGSQTGSMAGTPGNNGQSNAEKNGIGVAGGNSTSGTPPGELSRGNQQDVPGGNGNNPAGMSRNSSDIPGLKNQSGGDHGIFQDNTSTLPPGWVKNPNQVRETVQSLLAMENRTGGIGPRVSAIAREFNNSANAGREYEDRINNRDPFSRFFFGSDRQAAAGLANLTVQNQARITEIETLMETTAMDADTRSRMEGQLQILRLNLAFDQQLAARAQQDHGIFG
ncbi:MAG: hypothetical protein WC379_18090 [Methanoregula sp.]|jgi:hypothetical protein